MLCLVHAAGPERRWSVGKRTGRLRSCFFCMTYKVQAARRRDFVIDSLLYLSGAPTCRCGVAVGSIVSPAHRWNKALLSQCVSY